MTQMRADIQALRAIAVLAVVVFHLWPAALGGGYVGVDVFFVVSGFLITSHLLREVVRTGTVDLPAFWMRRIRRLQPAALLVLLCSALGIVLWGPRSLWLDWLQEVMASTLWIQNWLLGWHAVDYLAAHNAPSPVQHYWSLSAEEQFYLLFPLALLAGIWLARRRGLPPARAALGVLLVVAGASFVWSLWQTHFSPSMAYFSTFTRAWEFAAGALLAAGNLNALKPQEPVQTHKAFKSYEPGYVHVDVKYLPQMQDESSRRYLFVAIDRATRWVFLQFKANETAASARAFVAALHKACPIKISKLLTDNGKEFTDRLFASKEREPSGNHEFDQLCKELGIEHRLTKPRTPRTNGMVERFNGRIADVLKTHRFDSREDMQQTLERYVALYNHQLPQSALGSKTPMQTMKQWYQERPDLFHKRPYDRPGCDSYLAERNNWRIDFTGMSTCYFTNARKDARCASWLDFVHRTARENRYDAYLFSHSRSSSLVVREPDKSMQQTIVDGLVGAWEALPPAPIIALVDNPGTGPGRNIVQCYLQHQNDPQLSACDLDRTKALPFDGSREAAARLHNVKLIDLTDFYCDATTCPAVIGNVIVYRDDNHITRTWAKTLAPYLNQAIVAALAEYEVEAAQQQ